MRNIEEQVRDYLTEVEVGAVYPALLYLVHGDSLRVKSALEYMGPAISDIFYAAIGNRGALGFDEITHREVAISFPVTLVWTWFTMTVDIPIVATGNGLVPGTYDLYVKLKNRPAVGMPGVDDVIVVQAPQFRSFYIMAYEKAV